MESLGSTREMKETAQDQNGEAGQEEQWAGWEGVLQTLERLEGKFREEKERNVKRVSPPQRLTPPDAEGVRGTQSPSTGTRDRMSIRDLI